MDTLSNCQFNPRPQSSGFFEGGKIQKSSLWFLIFFFFLAVGSVLPNMTSFAQVITPTTPFVLTNQGCNQQNLRVTDIEFRAANPDDLEGTPIGQLVQGEIWATWAVQGNGYNPHIQFNISIDGNAPTAIANCVSLKNNGVARNIIDGEIFKIANFSWPYGSELSIDNLYIHWLTGSINSDTDACQTSAGNSQCSRPSATFLVRTPLVANFDFTANCDDFTVDFEDLSTGGNPAAYTYAWSFTGGNPASSGASDPQNVDFESANSYQVTLQVTSEGITRSVEKEVTLYGISPAPSVTVVDPTCELGTGSVSVNNPLETEEYALDAEFTNTTFTGLAPGDYIMYARTSGEDEDEDKDEDENEA